MIRPTLAATMVLALLSSGSAHATTCTFQRSGPVFAAKCAAQRYQSGATCESVQFPDTLRHGPIVTSGWSWGQCPQGFWATHLHAHIYA